GHWAQEVEDMSRREELYELIQDSCRRIAINALWVLTHLDKEKDNDWLATKRRDLIYYIMREEFVSKTRLMLNLLQRQTFRKEDFDADFIDFCIRRLTDNTQPYAIRASCIKLAYEQMKHYPELLQELVHTLDLLSQDKLSPGLHSARRQVTDRILRAKKSRGPKKEILEPLV
ncbi:MAG: hypothetical protein ACI4UA_03510, partial [Bacteroidaceae bacterium]